MVEFSFDEALMLEDFIRTFGIPLYPFSGFPDSDLCVTMMDFGYVDATETPGLYVLTHTGRTVLETIKKQMN